MNKLKITDTLTIPGTCLRFEAVRSGGPGGQNVNKLATKVHLFLDLPRCAVLTAIVKSRLRGLAGRRMVAGDQLRIMSQRHRNRDQNLEECRTRLVALLRAALVPPKRRRATRAPGWVEKKRRDSKQRRSKTKTLRRPPGDE